VRMTAIARGARISLATKKKSRLVSFRIPSRLEVERERTDDSPTGTRSFSRKLLGRVTDLLLLESSNLGSRETAVSDPRVGVSSGVSSRHPSEVLSVIDNEVAEGELMRVEEEGSDTEGENRNPEVDHCLNESSQTRS